MLGQRICGGRFLRIVNGRTYFGVCATIIQIPFILVINHSFDEHCSVYILAALFETIHRAEERFVQTGDETGWVIGIKESLPGSIYISCIAFVTSACTVFTIIQKHNSFRSIDSRRTAFGQMTVEVSVTWRKQLSQGAVCIYIRSPVD